MSNLTKEEFQLFIHYYKMKSWINCKAFVKLIHAFFYKTNLNLLISDIILMLGKDENEVNEIYNLTSGNPLLLSKISAWN